MDITDGNGKQYVCVCLLMVDKKKQQINVSFALETYKHLNIHGCGHKNSISVELPHMKRSYVYNVMEILWLVLASTKTIPEKNSKCQFNLWIMFNNAKKVRNKIYLMIHL